LKLFIRLIVLVGFIALVSACGPARETLATEVTQASLESTPSWTPTAKSTQSATRTLALILSSEKTVAPTETPAATETPVLGTTPDPAAATKPSEVAQTPELQEIGRFFEKNASRPFSYVPPEGWSPSSQTEGKMTSWSGPLQSSGMKCVLGFQIEKKDQSASAYAEDMISQLPADGSVTLVDSGEFATLSGVDAYKLILAGTMGETELLFGVYIFSYNGDVVTAPYMRLSAENAEQDALIDQSLKTFRFE
jgi:hypothetical protein